MIILLDTSTPICKLSLVDTDGRHDDEWHADRQLARGLLEYLQEQLTRRGKTFKDIEALGVFQGSGSFTGLRIGLTVLNTIADAEQIPIVGVSGEDWQKQALERLEKGENDRIVLPLYGREAHITMPSK